jgi:acyl carrier protein
MLENHVETKALIRDFLSSHIIKDKSIDLDDDTSLLLGGLVDSLGIVRLVTFLEDSLAIKVPLEDVTIENFETLGLLVSYLEARQAA